jgi:tRNA(fMet)-specific endonuclease VapC
MEAEMALRRAPQIHHRFARLLRELTGAVRVLDFGEAEARQAANLAPYLDGTSTSALDVQIAATALAHGLTLITESPQRFAFIPGLDAERWS